MKTNTTKTKLENEQFCWGVICKIRNPTTCSVHIYNIHTQSMPWKAKLHSGQLYTKHVQYLMHRASEKCNLLFEWMHFSKCPSIALLYCTESKMLPENIRSCMAWMSKSEFINERKCLTVQQHCQHYKTPITLIFLFFLNLCVMIYQDEGRNVDTIYT